jgi:hypothetical protein
VFRGIDTHSWPCDSDPLDLNSFVIDTHKSGCGTLVGFGFSFGAKINVR